MATLNDVWDFLQDLDSKPWRMKEGEDGPKILFQHLFLREFCDRVFDGVDCGIESMDDFSVITLTPEQEKEFEEYRFQVVFEEV